MLIGYARVSTAEQNPAHQIDALARAGVAPENVHVDRASGAKASRPKLDLVLALVRVGLSVDGCVPSKALLAAADARTATRFGIHTGPVTVDFAQVMRHVRAAIAAIEPVDSPATLRAAGVWVVSGTARFTGPDHAHIDSAHIDGSALSVTAIGGVPVRFRQALIATGSAPLLPPIPGLAEVAPRTSDTI